MPKKTSLSIFFSLVIWTVSAAAETTPQTYWTNRQGIEELKKSNPSAAQEKFLTALSKDPFEARLHLNLGLTFEVLGQMDKARASYQTALEVARDSMSKFAAQFNLGALAQKEKKVDVALSHYQEALNIYPDSQETKTNIELLIQDQKGKGKGEGENKDPNDKNQGKGEGQGQEQEQESDPKQDEKKQDQQDKPKEYEKKSKPQPKKFKSDQLSQGDVNKILGEIKQQEQKIRSEFNKKEVKEQPLDKDW